MSPACHIVLVEDSEPDAILVRHALSSQELEFRLEVFRDGEEAVEYIDRLDGDESAACPNLMLLDLNLPKLSGDFVLDRVRRSSRCNAMPVVILTSSGSPKDKAQAARLGATHYFQKPSRLEEFMKIGPLVKELLRGSRCLMRISEEGMPVRYRIMSPLIAVRMAAHPGSSMRDPTDTLVNIPPNVTVEIEGTVASSGLVTILWNGTAFSVLHEELESKAVVALG